MGLRIITTDDEQLVSKPVLDSLRAALETHGRATLLVPTRAQALEASRALSKYAGLSLGVTCDTPQSWAEGMWEILGDGSRLVEGSERIALVAMLLSATDDPCVSTLPRTAGTLKALSRILSECAASLPLTEEGRLDKTDARVMWLASSEQEILELAGIYLSLIRDRGLIELSQVMAEIPGRIAAMENVQPMVFAGFSSMRHAARELVCDMAALADTTFVAARPAGPAGELAESLAHDIATRAETRGLLAEEITVEAETTIDRDTEIAQLLAALYRGGSSESSIAPTGAVCLLETAGPVAEAELIAQTICELAGEGERSIVVCAPDVERIYNELVPKLAARGMHTTCAKPMGTTDIPQLRALLGFFEEIAELSEMEWPGPTTDETGAEVPVLGDMSWWPPRRVTDFLLSEISGVTRKKAWALDARFRGNRVLTPEQVLSMLQKEGNTSRGCAQATSMLLQGRVSQAIAQLSKAGFAGDSHISQEAIDALACVKSACDALMNVGVYCATDKSTSDGVSLSTYVELVRLVCECTNLVSRLEAGPEDGEVTVRICSRREAATLGSASIDSLIVCGLTTAECPVEAEEDAVEHLLEALELAPEDKPIAVERELFTNIVRLPKKHLVLERALRDTSSQVTYPTVSLVEVLSCYGVDPDEDDSAAHGLHVKSRAESLISENLDVRGTKPGQTATVELHSTGDISSRSRELVVVSHTQQTLERPAQISLSASQIESYLECPYKWFTLRRLGLHGLDAEFSGMEMGTFVHRVLEQTHSHMLLKAAREAGIVSADADDVSAVPSDITFVEGSAATTATLSTFHEVLEACIEEDLENQACTSHSRLSQSLIPHTVEEEWRLDRAKKDMSNFIDWEATRFQGFAPRFFELRFGGSAKDAMHVSYAGVDLVGTIDRIDVDRAGNAIVIDYKHKSPLSFAKEYDVFGKGGCASLEEFVLPRRVQSLIYAQIVRRLYPDLNVVGAVYASTRSDAHAQHELAGAVDSQFVDLVFGKSLSSARAARATCGAANISLYEVLDASEDGIANALEKLQEGLIRAEPADTRACEWCPAIRCERRLD